MKKRFHFLLLLCFIISFLSCMDDIDDILPENIDTEEASKFVYRALNFWYLYKDKTPELANDYFSTPNELNNFIADFDSPEKFFNYLKYDNDSFSVLIDDYEVLEKALQGKSMSTGAFFLNFKYQEKIYLLVRNVIKDSEAYNQGVTRGDVFYKINGQEITQNNLNELLSSTHLSLSKAYLNNGDIRETDEIISLNNTELEEPSIAMYKLLEINNQKIGYLLYNSFIAKYDSELNQVFEFFQNQNIDHLILDLRYNTGGSINSAAALANMITGQFQGEVMYEDEWNEDLNSFYSEVVYFSNKNNGKPITSLGLNSLTVLTQSRTASASELVINVLDPYIDLLQVGMNTRGKYQGSVLVYDSPNFSHRNKNLLHRYAMLPLVLKIKNSIGHTDFDKGLVADVIFEEHVEDIQDNLGTIEEPLLNKALQTMGFPVPQLRSEHSPSNIKVKHPMSTSLLENIMYKSIDK